MTDTTNPGGGGGGAGGGTEGGGSGRLGGLAQTAQQQFGQVATQARDWASQQGDVARQTVVERPFVSTGEASRAPREEAPYPALLG